ncbi:MAG: hypothetical protein WC506_05630 [Candidatus Micrarchaeia archaeon]
MKKPEPYEELEKKWPALARILFGVEIGDFSKFEPYLSEYLDPVVHKKSSISGKDATFASATYCTGARLARFDEMDYSKKYPALGINDMKDIDSLIDAVQERAIYAGSIILGDSKFIEKSSIVNNSHYAYNSAEVESSKYVAYSTCIRDSEMVYGCNTGGNVSYLLRSNGFIRITRCFETWVAANSSDCYYSHHLDGCQDCIFCFNLKGKRHAIGNLELPKDKYLSMKKKLLLEMASGLEKNKKAPSLVDLIPQKPGPAPQALLKQAFKGRQVNAPQQAANPAIIEEAFGATSSILIGKKLQGMGRFGPWLSRHVRASKKKPSAASGVPVMIANYGARYLIPDSRFVTQEESESLGDSLKLNNEEIEKLIDSFKGVQWKETSGVKASGQRKQGKEMAGVSASVNTKQAKEMTAASTSVKSTLDRIAFFHPAMLTGQNLNIIDCTYVLSSSNCSNSISVAFSDKCAYSFIPRYCEHVFGCSRAFHCSFCINCHNCARTIRSFEVDNATNCSDCYFSHNIENCHECMFCFNMKNLQYAIGNSEVGREKYMVAKAALQKWLQARLEKSASVDLDIFNFGCQNGKNR